jgi:hypothetical protein
VPPSPPPLPPSPSPSPPPPTLDPKLGAYIGSIIGNRIVVDIDYFEYARNEQVYVSKFIKTMADLLNLPSEANVRPYDYQQSTAGTAVVYFDIIIPDNDYSVNQITRSVLSLFPGADPTSVDVPASPDVLAAFQRNGFPIGAVYLNDQLTPHLPVTFSPPPPVPPEWIFSNAFGQYNVIQDAYFTNISITAYLQHIEAYNAALMRSLATILAAEVNQFQIVNVYSDPVGTHNHTLVQWSQVVSHLPLTPDGNTNFSSFYDVYNQYWEPPPNCVGNAALNAVLALNGFPGVLKIASCASSADYVPAGF